jgi:signal transduction histidine kinase
MAGKSSENVQKNIDLEEKIILLNKRIKELSNEKELFLQLAAHELMSPLRKIAIFANLLESKCNGNIPPEALNYIQRIRKNITAMQSIIDDLTSLSSIADTVSRTCDLNKILSETLAKLSGPISESNAVIRICTLPVMEANSSNMKTLFHNLLSNSIKFRKQDEMLEINISCAELTIEEKNNFYIPFENTYYKIKFADNGIGFNQQQASKIFEPFVQLNGKSEFYGNGLGLSICKKIAELQGGIIYSESNNAGSCFTLILPKLANNAHPGEN